MKSKIVLIIAFCAYLTGAHAQLHIPASYGPSIAFTTEYNNVIGPNAYYFRTGIAFNAKAEFTVARSFNLTAEAGVLGFFPGSTYSFYRKANNIPNGLYTFIPLKVGGRYYMGDTWYAEAQGGGVIYTSDYSHPAVTVSAGTGFSIPIDGAHAFDIGIRFENWMRKEYINQVNIDHMVAIRLAYKIGI